MGRVVLTGASGFIAAHVLQALLKDGRYVRFTVRSEEKAKYILDSNLEFAAQLEYAIVPDISVLGAFDDAVKGDFDAVIHTASPFYLNFKDPKTEMLDPAINGTRGLLESVKQYAPSVKRIVITGSFAAIINPDKGVWAGHVYSENDWNPITLETALNDFGQSYRGAKTFAEKAAWEFVEKEKPGFDVVVLNPAMVFGPIINSQSISSINTSNQRLWGYLSGQNTVVAPSGAHLWIDVRDLAQAHLKAYLVPEAGGKRFLAVSEDIYSNQDICDVLRKNFPEHRDRILEGNPGTRLGLKPGEYYVGDNSRSKDILGISYRSLEETLIDTARSLLELERKETGK